jgi:uncharacterized cupredoxin-like copper-binding protein
MTKMNINIFKTTALGALFTFSIAANSGAVFAAGAHTGGHNTKKGQGAEMRNGHAMAIGEPGDAAKVDRTIAITLKDNFFEPEEIAVKEGKTIRFVITNKGQFLHEFNIGTAVMHAAHQKEMAEMMEHDMITPTGVDHKMMAHNDANSVVVEPGKKAEVIWYFTKVAKLEFACNVPGHYESGMMGPIQFKQGH